MNNSNVCPLSLQNKIFTHALVFTCYQYHSCFGLKTIKQKESNIRGGQEKN